MTPIIFALASLLFVVTVSGIITFLLMMKKMSIYITENVQLRSELEQHDFYLDYVLRSYCLHLRDPYVDRPRYEEKRCYHCNYPIGHEHDTNCPWVYVRPLTSRLYPTAQR